MITGKTPEGEVPKTLGDLRLLGGVRRFPQRVKCATLAWHALKGCLADGKGEGTQSFSVDASGPDL